MHPDWEVIPVQSLLDTGMLLVEDGNHGEYRPLQHEFASDGTPFVRPDDLQAGRVAFDRCDRINSAAVARVRKGHGRPGDVLFTHRATVGRMALVRETDPAFVANPGVTIWRSLNHSVLDQRFLYYIMHCKDFMDQVWAVAGSTDTFPYVSLTEQRKLSLALPPHHEQVGIATALGALDDKIDLNRRMNETLEMMARAIFKDWFVDFGPTRAKMEGASPYLPPDVWSLFPDTLDDEDKPAGWSRNALGQHVLNFDSKRVPVSGADRAKRKGQYPYHGATGVMDYVDGYLFDGIYLLVGEDGSVETDDGLAFTQYVWGKVWVNNHAHVLQGKLPVSTEQLLLYFQHEAVAPYITGAVQLKLSQGRMNSMPLIFAGEALCRAFANEVQPFFAKLRCNSDETDSLAATRDLLLPRLMSGEIRIEDAEKVLEEVL